MGKGTDSTSSTGYNVAHTDVSPLPPSLQNWWCRSRTELGTFFHGAKYVSGLEVRNYKSGSDSS